MITKIFSETTTQHGEFLVMATPVRSIHNGCVQGCVKSSQKALTFIADIHPQSMSCLWFWVGLRKGVSGLPTDALSSTIIILSPVKQCLRNSSRL